MEKTTHSNKKDKILWHSKSRIQIAQIERFIIKYSGELPVWLKVKNVSKFKFRAGYLGGPFNVYCDVVTKKYKQSEKVEDTSDIPQFKSIIQPQDKFIIQLSQGGTSDSFLWIVNVMSEMLFNTDSHVSFEVSLGTCKSILKNKYLHHTNIENSEPNLSVEILNTQDIWGLHKSTNNTDTHLVVLTHGLHSNVTADMSYLMEQIYQHCSKDDNIVVEGFNGNVCQTEKGVKYLGYRLAEHIVTNLYTDSITKISFIGHSLGGLIQTFAMEYIFTKYPWFFEKVQPINFITLAAPLLGLHTVNNPAYVKYALSKGLVGKTGKDLSLHKDTLNDNQSLLYLMSGAPLPKILLKFQRRTLYANAINDGIVPLYTSSLLFLDYDDILEKLKSRKERLPSASIINSVTSILVPASPKETFLSDPELREDSIIHDRVYSEDHIDAIVERYSDTVLKSFYSSSKPNLQEVIARRWHHNGISWRKVIVATSGDAHNNIMVRRKFTNAYGWPVIDHLIQNHFKDNDESILPSISLSDKQLGEVDFVEPNKLFSWITRIEDPKIYKEGMLTVASGIFQRTMTPKKLESKEV
ncbi:hypothetical protein KAFR_0A06800 [Kazachstania africana CBS 2517]|uniref:DUF676 domain-containing protein n=1 Tax=Kazachstania africana (strain ATCC 22294 / BCRC 22015 / CBS 2517 / CECT 1963 / NBRC 1671 / NRRL Y-8276) TaxID=1071382 RepID=H2AP15_KAZAF|nr:hypothetical protein KAFR_0A06800 [Kazachstania africana CBS 2517]CCF56115.1 hypothetical protein KAFR_0A06800 [Kazachstania africana CBS 2517]